jgi:tryptophan synthase beta subunit
VLDQGHVGVLLGEQNLAEQKDPRILQSHPAVGGLNYTRLGASHDGGYYQYAVRPENWINHNKGGF